VDHPPSPLRPIVPRSGAGSRSPSPTSPDPARNDHYTPSGFRPGRPQDSKGRPPPVSHAEIRRVDVQSQSGSIVSGRSPTDDGRPDGAQSPNPGYRSPSEEDRERPAKPSPSAQGKRMVMATVQAERSQPLKSPSQSRPAWSRPPVTGGPRSFTNSINP
jgi:hypothetical protein